MSIVVTPVSISGTALFAGRDYRIAIRRTPLTSSDYYTTAEEDADVFFVTQKTPFPTPFAAAQAQVPNVDTMNPCSKAWDLGLILEECRRPGGPFTKSGAGILRLPTAFLERCVTAGEPLQLHTDIIASSAIRVDLTVSVLGSKSLLLPDPTPTSVSGSHLVSREEAANMRKQLRSMQAELSALKLKSVDCDAAALVMLAQQLERESAQFAKECGLTSTHGQVEQLEAHISCLNESITRAGGIARADRAIVQERDATVAQLSRLDPSLRHKNDLQNRLTSVRNILNGLDRESEHRDVGDEATAALAELDALDRVLPLLSLPASQRAVALKSRLATVQADLDQREASADLSSETASLLDELDILTNIVPDMETQAAEIVVPGFARWEALKGKEASVDHLRHVLRSFNMSQLHCGLLAHRSLHINSFPSFEGNQVSNRAQADLFH